MDIPHQENEVCRNAIAERLKFNGNDFVRNETYLQKNEIMRPKSKLIKMLRQHSAFNICR